MSNIHAPSQKIQTMSAIIIRADGRREELGTIVGETSILRKVGTYLRIKRLNLRTRFEQIFTWLQS
jgi:hypothetical protein